MQSTKDTLLRNFMALKSVLNTLQQWELKFWSKTFPWPRDSVAAILILAVTLGLVVLNLKSFARAISLAEKNYIHADTKYDETLFTILNKNKQSSDLWNIKSSI